MRLCHSDSCVPSVRGLSGRQVSTAGVEIGQGLYTKVAQSVAYKLGIDLSLITVVPTRSDSTPANTITGGSGTSETCVMVCVCVCVCVCS